jgi:bacteriorhodopsin
MLLYRITNKEPIIGIEDKTDKEESKKNPVQHYVKFSFVITYILLLTTGTITFIEAMRTKVLSARHILNLETAISVIAGYFYSVFAAQIDKFKEESKPIEWSDITKTRYIDWSITTPLMLLTLCMFLGSHANVPVRLPIIASIVGLNYLMLYCGYLGEIGTWTRITGLITGFVAFFAIAAIIFMVFLRPKYVKANYVLSGVYLFIWSMYGVVYMFDEEFKNISMNILDLIAKCFVGLGLWVYFTRIIS